MHTTVRTNRLFGLDVTRLSPPILRFPAPNTGLGASGRELKAINEQHGNEQKGKFSFHGFSLFQVECAANC
jgi:hypothetical protein